MTPNRMFASTLTLALCLSAAATLHAAPVSGADPVAPKVKMMHVHLKNVLSTPVEVKDGDQQVTIQPGKEISMKVPAGSQVTLAGSTPNHAAGDVIGTANGNLSNYAALIIN